MKERLRSVRPKPERNSNFSFRDALRRHLIIITTQNSWGQRNYS